MGSPGKSYHPLEAIISNSTICFEDFTGKRGHLKHEDTSLNPWKSNPPSFSKLPIVKSEVLIHRFWHKHISQFTAILNIA